MVLMNNFNVWFTSVFFSSRQNCEYSNLKQRRNMASTVLQNSIIQLTIEHRSQREHLQFHQRNVYKELCETWNNRLVERKEDYERRCAGLDEQISQIDGTGGSDHTNNGPNMVVKLRKGPCRATDGKHSMVTMVLAARIAQAISLEDDIYDNFYKYK